MTDIGKMAVRKFETNAPNSKKNTGFLTCPH